MSDNYLIIDFFKFQFQNLVFFCDTGLWNLHNTALDVQCKQDSEGEQQLCHYKAVQPSQCHGPGSWLTERVEKFYYKIESKFFSVFYLSPKNLLFLKGVTI